MAQASPLSSSSSRLGEWYDTASAVVAKAFNGHLHMGYWTSSTTTLAEAAEAMTDQLIARTPVKAGQRVLDVGSGTGRPALRLARATGAQVLGISLSQAETDRANALAGADPPPPPGGTRFERADVMALPYPPDSFDAVWAVESLAHVTDRAEALRQIARVLRPGGRLVLADGFLRSAADRDDTAVTTAHTTFFIAPVITLAAFTHLLRNAGLPPTTITDATDHARRSMTAWAAVVRDHPADYIPLFGETGFRQLLECWARENDLCDVIGYVLLTARRTATPRVE
ncbi:SAM-dependent methyltransferase [Streptantibioticus cattleyicolor]|uniref:D-glucose O-methyltransferase n=1 Tax=Streptantibioticus cattleyicolor (strain ATCC 35852 / DSM 46488 / JCM 4925 / NBRC 14057 / NRRL 8057) TaxID=1003195 RepID=F8JLJ1_STREN|nr:class I SAM-dependent methyltransferase [Streptantibioticus cattleyicolor]AEW98295.1 D-glucose O-methyltransferase [Streptantibioticus cattleyicolor NRRL 8057 = DSM 46488]CCB72647.1 D-glucose O-methyltransferase [Streptantibioticus cattleyicolor NRRL 8057 = DSM 46488]